MDERLKYELKMLNREFIFVMILFLVVTIICLASLIYPVGFGAEEEEEKYRTPKLSEVTCDNLEHHYDMCNANEYVWLVSSCRERYTPKLMQCYGRGVTHK
jgi:hypothetical protein